MVLWVVFVVFMVLMIVLMGRVVTVGSWPVGDCVVLLVAGDGS